MYYLKTSVIIILTILAIMAYYTLAFFAWAEYISLLLLLFFISIIIYALVKNWNRKRYLLLLIPIFLQLVIFFDALPSQKCDFPGSDTWSIKCDCKGIEVSEPIFGSSRCIGKVHNCKQKTLTGWKDYS